LVHGRTSLILPTLGRTDRDDKHPKGAQFLSVEDSMSVVHSTQGRLAPVSEHLLAEPVIVARMAEATFGPDHSLNWKGMAEDYDVIRDHISRVLPGFEDFNTRVRTKNGFVLPSTPRDTRSFKTDIGRGRFTVSQLEYLTSPDGHLVLQTIRSHDQYNTTFYGLDDRYRGISGGRRVILVHPEDLAELGFKDRDLVDVVSTFRGRPEGRKVPPRGLPHREGLRRCVLPRSQRPGSQRERGKGIQHRRLQGHVRPLRPARSWDAGLRRPSRRLPA
jgi:formate dehydrogenase major subunit